MPGFLYLLGTQTSCPHKGTVAPATTKPRVFVGVAKQAVLTIADQFPIGGCAFQIPFGVGTKPQPCVTVKWTMPSARLKIDGVPVLLTTSLGLCQSVEQIPQGPAIIATKKTPVVGT